MLGQQRVQGVVVDPQHLPERAPQPRPAEPGNQRREIVDRLAAGRGSAPAAFATA